MTGHLTLKASDKSADERCLSCLLLREASPLKNENALRLFFHFFSIFVLKVTLGKVNKSVKVFRAYSVATAA